MEAEGLKYNAGTLAVMKVRDSNSSLLTTNAAAEYEFDSLNGSIWIGANAAGTPVTTQAGLSATTPALVLYNPVNSGVNLVLLKVNVAVTAAPAAASTIMLAYNSSTATAPSSTTSATVTSSKVGVAGAPRGECYRVSTLAAAPTACRFLGGILAAASTNLVKISDNVNGEIVLAPGACVSIQATTAVAVLCDFTWKEVAI